MLPLDQVVGGADVAGQGVVGGEEGRHGALGQGGGDGVGQAHLGGWAGGVAARALGRVWWAGACFFFFFLVCLEEAKTNVCLRKEMPTLLKTQVSTLTLKVLCFSQYVYFSK